VSLPSSTEAGGEVVDIGDLEDQNGDADEAIRCGSMKRAEVMSTMTRSGRAARSCSRLGPDAWSKPIVGMGCQAVGGGAGDPGAGDGADANREEEIDRGGARGGDAAGRSGELNGAAEIVGDL
jgi:hypothetical protein